MGKLKLLPVGIYEYVCMHINTPKYNLLSLYNVTYMYVFRADHLVCSFLGKTISPTLSIPK